MRNPATLFRAKLPIAALLLVLPAFLALAPAAFAHSYKLGSIEIGHIWAPPPDENGDTAVYVPILNLGDKPVYLVGVSTEAAQKAVMRIVEDGKARLLDSIEFKPGRPLALAPWREHIWVEHLAKPLKAGDSFDLDLDFGDAGKIKVKVIVEDQGSH